MKFQPESITVNGVKVAMLTAGQGEPLLFWHGAGTWTGFDFALPWASKFRVLIPFHPGWNDSADAPEMTTPGDYVLHYLEMFDQLGLDRVNLVGFSMGGRLAATFAIEHRERVRRLVLIAPAGLDVPGHPLPDFKTIPPQEIPGYLAHDVGILAPYLPKGPDPEFGAARDREGGNFGKLMQNALVGPWLPRWLHRVDMPTFIAWGDKDRILSPAHAAEWKKLIPHATVRIFPDAGHLVADEKPECVEAISNFLL
ncbi:MAG TPA: alpha/beta hydrolase [Bryobacteraceae bacterium]|jgi:pimeloyl-ACP methyl ester carboxylesterase